MKSSTVNISFNSDLLVEIDRVAKQESRSRSELIREAAREYIERKNKWKDIFSYTEKVVEDLNVTEEDIRKEITIYRKSRKLNSK